MANGKKHDLNHDEYVVGSMLIYFDIVAYPIEFMLEPEGSRGRNQDWAI